MPLPLTEDMRNALRAREIAHAWMLDLYCESGGSAATLRGWDKTEAITYGGDTYEALGDRWGIEGEIRSSSNLVAQPLTIWFDGATQLDDASFVGRLLDRTWHQRRVRLRQVLMTPGSNFVTVIGTAFEWRGFMDTIEAPEGSAGQSRVMLNCESGTFRARARNYHTVTDANQRLRDANDASFANLAVKAFQDIPFGLDVSTPAVSGPRNEGDRAGRATGNVRGGGPSDTIRFESTN